MRMFGAHAYEVPLNRKSSSSCMNYEIHMVRWLEGSSGLLSVPIIPSESDQNLHKCLRGESLPFLIAIVHESSIQFLQQVCVPSINTKKHPPRLFRHIVTHNVMRRVFNRLVFQELTLLSIYFCPAHWHMLTGSCS